MPISLNYKMAASSGEQSHSSDLTFPGLQQHSRGVAEIEAALRFAVKSLDTGLPSSALSFQYPGNFNIEPSGQQPLEGYERLN